MTPTLEQAGSSHYWRTRAEKAEAELEFRRLAAKTEDEGFAAVTDECERLRADAARYRWLREQCNTRTNLVQYNRGDVGWTVPCHSATDMDAAIDAAMKGAA